MANTKSPDDGTGAGERELTVTERARRAQLIDATINLIADTGHAGASLSGIAKRAGITKAAVLYYYPSKTDLVSTAYEHVLGRLTEHVGGAVEAVGVEHQPAAYIRAMVGYIRENPRQTRMLTETLINEDKDTTPVERWQPLAQILDAAREATGATNVVDTRTFAIIISGAVDGIVGEQLRDPSYDTEAAAEQLVELVNAHLAG